MIPEKSTALVLVQERKQFFGSHDDLELSLEAAIQYRLTCEYEGVSWEGIRAKYDKIKKKLCLKDIQT